MRFNCIAVRDNFTAAIYRNEDIFDTIQSIMLRMSDKFNRIYEDSLVDPDIITMDCRISIGDRTYMVLRYAKQGMIEKLAEVQRDEI